MIPSSLRALVLFVVLFLLPALALADPSDADRATARELGSAGLAALDAKDYATAVERFSRAIALFDAPTLRVGRARAQRGLNHLVSASEDYRAVLLRAPSSSDPPAIVQATRDAKQELPAVEANIAHLTVLLTGAPGTLRVDGVEWSAAVIGIPRPLDPGEHLVEAFSSNLQVQSQRVTLTPGQSARLEIQLAAPSDSRAPIGQVGSPPPLVAVAPTQAPGAPPAMPPPSPGSDHTAAFVTAGIAGALAAGAVVTGLVATSKKSDFNKQNRPDVPHGTKDDLRSQASSMALVSTVLTGAAVVAGGVSIYLFVVPSRVETATRTIDSVNLALLLSRTF